MANDIPYCVYVIFIITIKSVSSLSETNSTNSDATTPKIFLNDTHYKGLLQNHTYNLTNHNLRELKISCISDRPTEWKWKVSEDPESEVFKSVSVAKDRKQFDGFTTFSSNLTLALDSLKPLDVNFSCYFVENKNREVWLNKSVACVGFKDTTTLKQVRVFYGIHLRDCLPNIHGPPPENYSIGVDVSLDKLEVKCIKHNLRSIECRNLDECDSYSFVANYDDSSEAIDHINNNSTENSMTLKNCPVLPLIVCCKKRTDLSISWSSYKYLYPSNRGRNWKNFSFHETIEEARNNNSIMLYALLPEQTFEEVSDFNNLTIRSEFAEGEVVHFVCVGIKYLFMQGFQWMIGNRTLPDYEIENYAITDKSTESLYVLQREITMNSTEFGDYSQVSCRAPIWNSKRFETSKINVTLYSASPPKVNGVDCKDNNSTQYINCSCCFTGWPQPSVFWKGNNEPLKSMPPSMEVSNASTRPYVKTWISHQLFLRPTISSSGPQPLVVACVVKNFKGNQIYNYTFAIENASDAVAKINKELRLYSRIIISLASVCALAFVIAIVIYWRYRKKLVVYAERKHHLTVEEIDEFYSGASTTYTTCQALLLPYNSEYEIPRETIILDGSILGSGQFGLVLRGNIGDTTVAVKTTKPTTDCIYFKSLLSELKILQFIGHHPNIVNLIGANTANIKKREVFLILDFCSNGSLLNVLRLCRERFINFLAESCSEENRTLSPLYENSGNILLTTSNLFTFSIDCACALNYLASKNIVHADIAARNVLVTENLHAKLCDFGISKQLLHYTVYVQKIDCPLPLRWMSPESLQDMEFSLASDKWSYGVLLWEIFSMGEIPYPGEEWSFSSYQMLIGGYRMQKPKYANESLYKLMLECWNVRPQERPSFEYLMSQLKEEVEMMM